MLTEYIRAAMHEARYELMEDGRFFAVIPPCAGLWADGETLEGAREQLQDVLEDWILIKACHGDVFPVIPSPEFRQSRVRETASEQLTKLYRIRGMEESEISASASAPVIDFVCLADSALCNSVN